MCVSMVFNVYSNGQDATFEIWRHILSLQLDKKLTAYIINMIKNVFVMTKITYRR